MAQRRTHPPPRAHTRSLGSMAVCTLTHETASKYVQAHPVPGEFSQLWGADPDREGAGFGSVSPPLRDGGLPPARDLTQSPGRRHPLPGQLAALLGHSFPPCFAGFAVAQCINQHSSSSLSSPSPSASGSPGGSGSTSHCDSGGASSSSTPSAAQSPTGIGRGTRCGGGRLEETLRPHPLRFLAAPRRRVWGLCHPGFRLHSSVPSAVGGWLGPQQARNGSLHGLVPGPQSWRGGQRATQPQFIPLSPPESQVLQGGVSQM